MERDGFSRPTSFDPFGQPVDARPAAAEAAGDRLARRVGAAIFWTLAALILAGRVYVAAPTSGPGLLLVELAGTVQAVMR